jgi:hypothetical protein
LADYKVSRLDQAPPHEQCQRIFGNARNGNICRGVYGFTKAIQSMLETMADSEPTQSLDRALSRPQISWSLSKRITGLVVLRRAH